MNCTYCQREREYSICLFCDGKHVARQINRHLSVERNIAAGNEQSAYFKENAVLEIIKKNGIKGFEGLSQIERQEFFAGYNAEWRKIRCS